MGFGLKESLPRAKTGMGLRVKEAPSEGNIRTAPDIDWGWVLALGVPLVLLICFWTGIFNVDKTVPVSATMSEGLDGLQNFVSNIIPGGNFLVLIGVAGGIVMIFSAIVGSIHSMD